MTEKKLVKKLAEVMQQVKYIQKTGYNSFHKYRYATEADVNEKVREELSARNVIMIPNVKSQNVRTHTTAKGSTEYIATVEVEFTFMDGETGETLSFSTFGEGQDAGDKGTYKAITGAQKYALMKAFMIPTGDDPEADEGVDQRNSASTQQGSKQDSANVGQQKLQEAKAKAAYEANQPTSNKVSGNSISEAQLKLFATKAKQSGYKSPEQVAHFKAELLEKFGVNEPADLPKAKFNQALEWITTTSAPMETNVGLKDEELPF